MTTISVVFKRRRRKRWDHVKFSEQYDTSCKEKIKANESNEPTVSTVKHDFIIQENNRCKFISNEGEMIQIYKQITSFDKDEVDEEDNNVKSAYKFCMLKSSIRKGGTNNVKKNLSETNNVLSKLTCVFLLILFTKFTCQVDCNPTASSESTAPYYYANLPKLGYISGARLKVIEKHNKQQSSTNQYVAAFLGIPYAAPPVGLLRLMPPGANPVTTAHQVHQGEHLLLPSRQRYSVKAHTEFAHECVHLSDWLEPAKESIPLDRSGNQLSGRMGGADANNREREKESLEIDTDIEGEIERKRQSEDCLNLNVFIPINESNKKKKQTTNKDHEQTHQIKLNYPSQYFANQSQNPNLNVSLNRRATTTTNDIVSSSTNYSNSSQDDLDNKEKSGDQDSNEELSQINHEPLWSIGSYLNDSEKKLPVLVLFHGTKYEGKVRQSRPNTLNYLSTTHLLNSIVITFNYRIGLLGFLPYIDEEGSLDGLKSMPRNNHAIWDQLGLLHWLRHNVASFQGDPNNIALLPLDNQAAQFVQILILSPLAKGLFNRVFLVYDNTRDINVKHSNLNQMLSPLDDTRDLRRKLMATLSSIVKQLIQKEQTYSGRVFDFIQSATLPELAQLDQQLNQLGSEQLIALANEPTLHDRVLFPHLSLFTKGTTSNQVETSLQQNRLNQTILQSEVNYCLYLRQLATTGLDPLNLISNFNSTKSLIYSNQVIPVKEQQTNVNTQQSAETKLGVSTWHRDNIDNATTKLNNIVRRTQAAIYFNHMRQISLLNKHLNDFGRKSSEELIFDIDISDNNSDQDGLNKLQLHDYDEDQQQVATIERRPGKRSSGNESSLATNRRSVTEYIGNHLNQLMPSVSSFDLMIGFIETFPNNNHDIKKRLVRPIKDFQNIANILVNSSDILDERLIFWLKLADHHSIANLANNRSSLARLCNLDILAKPIPLMKTSHVFTVHSHPKAQTKQAQNEESWLLDAPNNPQLVTGLANFIKYGIANDRTNQSMSSYWPIYNSLDRKIKRFTADVTTRTSNNISVSLTRQVQIQLDILPYLSLLNTFINNSKNNTDDLPDLLSCLNDIDAAVSESNFSRSDFHNDSIVPKSMELQNQLKCLSSLSLRFKNEIRQFGSEDLEPLIRFMNLQKNRYLERGHNGASSSSITTRNLVDEGPILNNLEQSDASGQLEIEVASSNGSSLIAYVSSNNLQDQANTSAGSKKSTMGIKGFLANAYKDPVGKALTLVVGTGLLIFLLNLVIVAIITLRSSRGRSIGQQSVEGEAYSHSQNHQQLPDNGTENCVRTFQVNNKKSTLRKGSRRYNSEIDESQPMNSSFKNDRQGNACSSMNSSKGVKQLKFDLTGVPIGRESFLGEEFNEYNCQNNFNEKMNQQTGDTLQMCEFRGHEDSRDNNANRLGCYHAEDKQIMLVNDFDETGILLSISPLLTKYNSSGMNEHLLSNDGQQQQQQGQRSELEDQKLWPHLKISESNELCSKQYTEQQARSTYYNNDDNHHHFHPHHQYKNSNNSPITSTQSNSTLATICPTNTYNSFNNSSLDQKIQRDIPASCLASHNDQLNNKLSSCFHQNQHHHHHHIQNQSSVSPGSSATLSVTPIPIQLESLTSTQTGYFNRNFHLDSIYPIENHQNFVTFSDQTDLISQRQHQQLDDTS